MESLLNKFEVSNEWIYHRILSEIASKPASSFALNQIIRK